jgi:phytol kinase
MDSLTSIFIKNIPSSGAILLGAPMCLLWSYCCLKFAAYLKCARGLKTGYTRKTFHVLIFLSVVILQLMWGLTVVCLFGSMVSLVIAYALVRGAGHPLYEALAREQDAPHRSYYIIVPYLATLIGGVVSNLLLGPFCVIGYLVGGIGDAAGEPVGTKWGRHRYAVPAFGKVRVTRSYEGSIGVLVASLIALLIGLAVSPQFHFSFRSVMVLPAIAACCALAEATSPHGWDNTTMQVVPAVMALILL